MCNIQQAILIFLKLLYFRLLLLVLNFDMYYRYNIITNYIITENYKDRRSHQEFATS